MEFDDLEISKIFSTRALCNIVKYLNFIAMVNVSAEIQTKRSGKKYDAGLAALPKMADKCKKTSYSIMTVVLSVAKRANWNVWH